MTLSSSATAETVLLDELIPLEKKGNNSRTFEYRRNAADHVAQQRIYRRRRQNRALKKNGRRRDMEQHPIHRAAPNRQQTRRQELTADEAIKLSLQQESDRNVHAHLRAEEQKESIPATQECTLTYATVVTAEAVLLDELIPLEKKGNNSRTFEYRRNAADHVAQQLSYRLQRQNRALKKNAKRRGMEQHPIHRAAPNRRQKRRPELTADEAIELSLQHGFQDKTIEPSRQQESDPNVYAQLKAEEQRKSILAAIEERTLAYTKAVGDYLIAREHASRLQFFSFLAGSEEDAKATGAACQRTLTALAERVQEELRASWDLFFHILRQPELNLA